MKNKILIEKIEEYIKKNIPNRLEHTLSVRDIALLISKTVKIDAPKEKIIHAALLHDCARHYNLEDMRKILTENGDVYSENESASLLHSKVGAVIAKNEFGIEDEDTLNAIKYHTTGRSGMSMLEKIIYSADYLDPTRNIEKTHVILDKILDNFDEGFIDVVIESVLYVFKTKRYLAPETIELYNECILRRF